MQSLATLLPYLRLQDQERRLWIDAICINQEDLAERSSQVKLMSKIYKQAEQVVLWLGLEDSDTRKAFDLLHRLGTAVTVDWPSRTMLPTSAEHQMLADKLEVLPLNSGDYHSLNSIICRSWFDRLWIRQEVQLAREAVLVCGDLALNWTTFRHAMYCIFTKPSADSDLIRAMENLGPDYKIPFTNERLKHVVDLIDYGGNYMDLGQRIFLARYSECSDARDRIFAVMSLLYEDEWWDFDPDYTKSKDEVYEDATYSYIEAAGDLECLAYCGGGNLAAGGDGLPSWVPRWDQLHAVPSTFSTGNAACMSWPCFRRETMPAGSILHVKGLAVDTVKIAYEYTELSAVRLRTLVELRRLLRLVVDLLCDNDNVRSALNRTLIGRDSQDLSEPPNMSLPTEKDQREALDTLLSDDVSDADCEDILTVRHYLRQVIPYCRHRALFVTNTDQIGLGPWALKPDDQIVVFFGARTPYALRPVSEPPMHARLLGQCQLESLMSGEAFLGPLPSHWDWIAKRGEGAYGEMYMDAFRTSRAGITQWDDPRWTLNLGEAYPHQGSLETAEERELNEQRMEEVVKKRGLECVWFALV
jgi:hypothetical protein